MYLYVSFVEEELSFEISKVNFVGVYRYKLLLFQILEIYKKQTTHKGWNVAIGIIYHTWKMQRSKMLVVCGVVAAFVYL